MKKILIALFLALPCSTWALTPLQITNATNSAQYIFNAYARALRVLPTSWGCFISKKIGIYVYAETGESAYGVFTSSINQCTSDYTSYGNSEYVYGLIENISCNSQGYCNKANWTKGTATLGGSECYIERYFDRNNNPQFINTCGSNYRPSCTIVAYGWTSNDFYDLGTSNQRFPYDNYFSLNFRYTPSCSGNIPIDSNSYWIPAPTFANQSDISEIRSAIIEAQKINYAPEVITNFETDFNGDNATFNSALNYIDNGVKVSSGVPQLYSSPPDASVYTEQVSQSSVNVNVSITNIVNVSTAEIVNELSEVNNYFTRGNEPEIDTFDYNAVSEPIIHKSSALLTNYLNEFSSSSFFTILDKFEVEESSSALFPCVNFDVTFLGFNEQFCPEALPGFDMVVNVCFALFQIACFMFSCRILYKGG